MQLHPQKNLPLRNCTKVFTDTNGLVMVIGELKKYISAVCQNLTELKFCLRFLRENSSIICLKLMLRSR